VFCAAIKEVFITAITTDFIGWTSLYLVSMMQMTDGVNENPNLVKIIILTQSMVKH
jgi:hypothetical protein